VRRVETAEQMLAACRESLPADVAVCAAAVSDWKVAAQASQKIKKDGKAPRLELVANPDILATLAQAGNARPALVIGFAAETENVVENAIAKRARKGADWIIANDVSGDVMGGDRNRIHLISENGTEDWPDMTKTEVGARLAERIAEKLKGAA